MQKIVVHKSHQSTTESYTIEKYAATASCVSSLITEVMLNMASSYTVDLRF